MKTRTILIGIFLLQTLLICQQTTTTGNFLRIDFTKNEINRGDTVWQWKEIKSVGFNTYENIVSIDKVGKDEYITKLTGTDDPYLPKMINTIYNVTTKKEIRLLETLPGIDYDPFVYYVPKSLQANKGIWFFYGFRSSAIFVRNDSVFNSQATNGINPFHLCGIVNEKTIICIKDLIAPFANYDVDLSNSPKIKVNSIVWYNNDILLIRDIYYLKDTLFLIKGSAIELDKINSNGIITLKGNISPPGSVMLSDIRFHMIGENIYYVENKKLVRKSFSYGAYNFQNKKVLIDTLTNLSSSDSYNTFSRDSKYFSYISNDTLVVYSLSDEKEIFRQSINSIKYAANIKIDYPYVYLKQTKTVTDIKQIDELPDSYSLSQNYPNPFNPSTTIRYEIPVVDALSAAEVPVALKVFDLLGREIKTLVNEEKSPGNYFIQFDGSNLPSGIYFYRLQAGNPSSGSGQVYSETKKMILMK